MHEKLSQAVKLYDQLLTEQITRPTWRTASTSQSTYNRIPSQYHTDGSTRPELGEWSQQHVSSPQPGDQRYQTVSGYHPTYASPPAQNRPPTQRQSSYASEYGTMNTYAQPPPPVQVPESYHPSSTPAPLGSSYQEPYAQQQHSWTQPAYTETPASPPQQVPVSQLQQVYQPPTPAQDQWSQSQQYHLQHAATEQRLQTPGQQPQSHPYPQHTSVSPPVVHQHPRSQHLPPTSSTIAHERHSTSQHLPPVSSAPITQQLYLPTVGQPVQSPPPQSRQSYYQPASSSTLSRHNTISNPSYVSSAPQSSSVTLGRSHTTASHSHSRSQHAYVPSVATSNPIPVFPSVPTSSPEVFTMHSPPTTGFEQIEKKEVALIDL